MQEDMMLQNIKLQDVKCKTNVVLIAAWIKDVGVDNT